MSKFNDYGDGGGLEALKDGTQDLNLNTLKLQSLVPNLPCKTGASKEIYSTLLSTADTTGLDLQLAQKTTLGFVHTTTPPQPSAPGQVQIYSKNDDKLYKLTSAGVEVEIGNTGGAGGGGAWLFNTNLSGDPTAFSVLFNNATSALVTSISIRKEDFNGKINTVLLATMQGGDQIWFQDSTSSNSKLYTVSNAGTDNGAYFTFVCTFESQDLTPNYVDGLYLNVSILLQNPFNQQLNTTSSVTFKDVALLDDVPDLVLATGLIHQAGGTQLSTLTTQENNLDMTRIETFSTEAHSVGNYGSELVVSTVKNTEDVLTECAVFKEGGIYSQNVVVQSAGDANQATLNYTGVTNQTIDLDTLAVATPQNLSTGLLSGGVLSIGTPSATFTLSAGKGQIVTTDPLGTGDITSETIVWTAFSNIPVTNIATQLITFISIDSNGLIIQSPNRPTNQERRGRIFIGVVVHLDNIIVNTVNNQQDYSSEPISQLRDLSSAIGFININGNVLGPSSNNLTITKTNGNIYAVGSNYNTDPDNPNILNLPLFNTNVTGTIQYRTATSGNTTPSAFVKPDEWENPIGTVAVVGNNKYTTQRFFIFTSGQIVVQRGQSEYNSILEAESDLTGVFTVEPSAAANGLLFGYLVIKKGVTDLTAGVLAGTVSFFQSSKFGVITATTTASTLQNVYDNSTPPQITTTVAAGAVTLRRGTASDTNNVFEIENGATNNTFQVRGDGTVVIGPLLSSYTLPNGRGSLNQVLISDGGGVVSWGDINTDLSITNRTTTALTVASSTGTDAVIPESTTSLAGLINSTDKTKLDGLTVTSLTNAGTESLVSTSTGALKGLIAGTNITFSSSGTDVTINGSNDPRIDAYVSTATLTVDTSLFDTAVVTSLSEAINIANPTGTPGEGRKLTIRIKDNATARAITYDTQFRAFGAALPTSTVISKTLYIGAIYNSTDTKWDVVAVSAEV